METQLTASLELINDCMKFRSAVEGKPDIITDYLPPFGDGKSLLPLELFLSSLGACIGGAVSAVLRKMRKDVSGLQLHVTGERRQEHPTGFTRIWVKLELRSADATTADLQKAVAAAEGICPIWSMLREDVAVSFDLSLKHVKEAV